MKRRKSKFSDYILNTLVEGICMVVGVLHIYMGFYVTHMFD